MAFQPCEPSGRVVGFAGVTLVLSKDKTDHIRVRGIVMNIKTSLSVMT